MSENWREFDPQGFESFPPWALFMATRDAWLTNAPVNEPLTWEGDNA